MSRIELVNVTVNGQKETYIVDNQDNYHIIYEITDSDLTQPMGYYDPEKNDVTLIDADEEDLDYIELVSKHDEIRKIDPDGVNKLVESLQMAEEVPTPVVQPMDDVITIEPKPSKLEELDIVSPETLDTSLIGLDKLAEIVLEKDQVEKLGNVEAEKT